MSEELTPTPGSEPKESKSAKRAADKRVPQEQPAVDPLVDVSRRYHETDKAILDRRKKLEVAQRTVENLTNEIERLNTTKTDIRKQLRESAGE